MISLKLCLKTLVRTLVALVIISSLLVPAAYCQETEDSQIFISGFNSYQQKDYPAAIDKMNEVLQKYPDTPLRDMALFWLARAYYRSGNQQEAARYMSQFTREYPDNPLKNTVEEDLLNLVSRYNKGEKLPTGTGVGQPAENVAEARKAKAAQERLAQETAEKERLAREAAEKAEQDKIAAARAEEEKVAAEKAAREKADQERIAAEQAEQRRLAAEKAEQEKIAAEKAEQERVAAKAEQAEQERIAAEKAEQQRVAQLKAEEERKATEMAEQQRLAAQAEEARTQAAEKAEQDRIAVAKAEQEKIAAEKAEQDKLAAEKAAQVKAEQERIAAEQAEQQRLAAKKAEQEKVAAEKAEQERVAAKAEQERQALLKAAADRKAAERAEQQRQAAKAEEERQQAAEKVEQAKAAAAKAEQQRLAEEQRAARQQEAEAQGRAEKAALREKAIAQFKAIIEQYPGTRAAEAAAAKLQELGIAVALPPAVAAAEQKPAEQPENAQVLRLEVAQYAGFEFNLLARPQTFEVARRIGLPFEITNRGNGKDSFYLESGFPADFNVSFAADATPEQTINQTPVLAPGETFKGIINLIIPAASIDGLRITHPVKAASRFMSEATQSREVSMVASAPLLRAVVKADKTQPLPGDRITYRIAVLNVGSTSAQHVTLRLNFPPQLEPVDYATAGFKQEMKAALVYDGLQINSGENKEFSVTFQLKDDSLANQELLCRAELVNSQLNTNAVFVSNAAYVQALHGISVHPVSEKLVIIPGQTVTVPFVVTNTGNVREKFKIESVIKGAKDVVVFHDLNRDGIRQASEPVITEIGPLESREEAGIALEMKTPRSASDSSEGNVQVSFVSESDASRVATASALLVYSRPVLQMAMSSRDGRLKPGEVASFDLTITNFGTNLARVVELHSAWPEQLELVATDPTDSSVVDGNILWKFKELGAGEKRTIKVSFRVKPGTGVGTNIQVKNVLNYEDQLGNRY